MAIRWDKTVATSCRLLTALVLFGCTGELQSPDEGWVDDEEDAGAPSADEHDGEGDPVQVPDGGSGEAEGGSGDAEGHAPGDGGAPEDAVDGEASEDPPEDTEDPPPSDDSVLLCAEVDGECFMRSDCPAGSHMHEEAECMGPKTCCVAD